MELIDGVRLAAPDAFLLLWAIPPLIALFVFASLRRRRALLRFAGDRRRPDAGRRNARPLKGGLLVAALVLIVVALARPGWTPETRTVERRGRDVVFVVDVSRSMLARDLAPNRLERSKLAILDTLEVLRGDRVALVAFAGTAVVKSPLTFDYGFVRLAVERLSTGSVSRGGTLIGDALRVVRDSVFGDQAGAFRDVVLITDGGDMDSLPLQAAGELGALGVRVIAVGLGDEDTGQPIPDADADGGYLQNEGQPVLTALDGRALRELAGVTPGGRYVNVATGNFDLGALYLQLIAGADRQLLQSTEREVFRERFQPFLAAALALLALEFLLPDLLRRSRRRDRRRPEPGVRDAGPGASGLRDAGRRDRRVQGESEAEIDGDKDSGAGAARAGRGPAGPRSDGGAGPRAGGRPGRPGAVTAAAALLALTAALAAPAPAPAGGVPERAARDGRQAYAEGRFADAAAAFGAAAEARPEVAELRYDSGISRYRAGDLAGAADALRQAVEQAGRPELAAAGHFALGNAGVRAAEQALGAEAGAPADPQAAIAGLAAAAESYRRALDLTPDWEDAAHNLEVARLLLQQLREQSPPPERSAGDPQQQDQQSGGQDAAGAEGEDTPSPEQAGGGEPPDQQQDAEQQTPEQPGGRETPDQQQTEPEQPAGEEPAGEAPGGEAPDAEPDEQAWAIIAEEEERAEQRRLEQLRTEPVERDW